MPGLEECAPRLLPVESVIPLSAIVFYVWVHAGGTAPSDLSVTVDVVLNGFATQTVAGHPKSYTPEREASSYALTNSSEGKHTSKVHPAGKNKRYRRSR